MKKTLFTICSIALVCFAIMISCTKDDTSGETKVGYYSQPSSTHNSGGSNLNPNPNGNPYNVLTPTVTPTPTVAPTVYSVTLTTGSGPVTGSISSSNCSGSSMTGTCSNSQIATVILTFSSAPTVGSYSVVSSGVAAGQVEVSYNGANFASAGTVAITTVSGSNLATLNNVTGTTFTLTGSISCQ